MALVRHVPLLLLCVAANEVALASARLGGQGSVGSPAPARPTYSEWQGRQANATTEKAGMVARQAKMAAVNKVIFMLEDLRTKVLAEGEQEAATYNKFACFCKDTTAQKNADIETNTNDQTTLSTDIGVLEVTRTGLDTDIRNWLADIDQAEQDMKAADATRAETLKLFQANSADLKAALEALEGAIQTLKASNNHPLTQPSLVQLQEVQKTLRYASLLADALGLGGVSKQMPTVPIEDYKFHSEGIITTLEKLLDDFRSKDAEVRRDEVTSVAAHTMFMQQKENYVKQKKIEIDEAKQHRAETIEEIEMKGQQLTTVSAMLLDDKEYLSELAEICNQKAVTWDQRTQTRQAELTTLTQVIGIMQNAVSDRTSAATIRFAQQGVSVRLAQELAEDDGSMQALEADTESSEAAEANAPPAFLQSSQDHSKASSSSPNKRTPVTTDGRSDIAALLRSRGKALKSSILSSLANQISNSADPFAKVKFLIQELLERFLTQQGNEANQKAWCDKAIADAKQQRDYAAEKIRALNGEMAELEATRNKLLEEIEVLSKEISELIAARAEAELIRSEEKAENEATVMEAQSGLDAIDMGIDILTKWYLTADNGIGINGTTGTSFVQRGPLDDAPEQSFGLGEYYKGAQSDSKGIVGMMQVIKSDFERTVSETEVAEAEAEQSHLAFMTETGKSLEEKKSAKSHKNKHKLEVEGKLADADSDLDTQTNLLTTKLKELLDLKPVCIDTGMSYADRVANREDEIAALKKALCIFEAYAEYGPDGAANSC